MNIQDHLTWLLPVLSGISVKWMYELEILKRKILIRRIVTTFIMAFVLGYTSFLISNEYALNHVWKWLLIGGTAALSEAIVKKLFDRKTLNYFIKSKLPDVLDKK